jgi:hypothetical protein
VNARTSAAPKPARRPLPYLLVCICGFVAGGNRAICPQCKRDLINTHEAEGFGG